MPPPSCRTLRAAGTLAAVFLGLVAASSAGLAEPSESKRSEARARLSGLEDDLAGAVARYDKARARVMSVLHEIAETEAAISKLAQKMLRREKAAIALAEELYKGGSTVALQSMLTADSLAEIATRIKYLESSGELQATVFERLAVEHALLEKKLDRLERARAEAIETEKAMAELKSRIAADIDAQRGKLTEVDAVVVQRAEKVVAYTPPPVIPIPPAPSSGADWDAIAQCESGGRWHLDSVYDGGLQFHPMTWLGYGGGKYARYAWQATKAQQIAIAEKVLADQGPGAWPNCFRWK